MATEVIMPQLGESVIEGTIAAWLKKPGDRVEQYEPILEIETDKVTTEATAEVAGTLLKILVPEGTTVEVGTVLAFIGDADEVADKLIETDQTAVPSEEPGGEMPVRSPSRAAQPGTNGGGTARSRPYTGRISPVVGRIAEEHGVDLNQVKGTGRNGRITKKDILAYIEEREPQVTRVEPPPVVTSQPPVPSERLPAPSSGTLAPEAAPGQVLPLTNIRKAIAEHMVRSKHTSPHVTTVFDIDFSAVAVHRAANKASFSRDGASLTFTAYIVAAIVTALKSHPIVNSSWSDNGILLHNEINIGMATAIPGGLIVPVIKNADGFSLLGLARTVNDLSDRARNNQLQPDEVQGGTFSLTNHGVSGSLFATPIINQPQCGILGIGKIEKRVRVIDDAIAIRPMAYASLTFDHRILDGASADAFMSVLKAELENWQ